MVAEISLIRSQASEASEQRVLVQCMSTGYCTRTLTDVTSTPLQQEQTHTVPSYVRSNMVNATDGRPSACTCQ
jgi:hypothetical protein